MIKLVIFDFDGVFTDGKIIFDSQGNAIKHYNAKDGMGIARLHDQGFKIGCVTGWSDNVSQRSILKHLKINRISFNSKNKLNIINQWCRELDIRLDEVAYMGDDINDINVMKEVKLVACPKDSVKDVKEIANIICKNNGGNGAVREFCEYLIYLRNDITILNEKKNEFNITNDKGIIILDEIKNEFNYQFEKYDMKEIIKIADILKNANGNIFFCGVGKSGNIAKHCCDLLKSISFKCFYFDLLNSTHGDIGVLKESDIMVLFSNSGNTNEIVSLFSLLKEKGVILVGIDCNEKSQFNESCHHVIHLPFNQEIGGNISCIPTNSVMSQLLLCNVLVSLLKRDITIDEYKQNHRSGNIGISMLKIQDVLLHKYPKIVFTGQVSLNDVYFEMINNKIGCCFFVKENDELIGIMTDGDIRRMLFHNNNLRTITIEHINTDFYFEDNLQKTIFECKNVGCIPVIKDKKIIGIFTNNFDTL